MDIFYKCGLFLLCLLFIQVQETEAQQMPHYSGFEQNWYALNPAYGGMDLGLRVRGVYRSQWNQLQGQPERYHLNAHMPLAALKGGGGVIFQSESIGPRTLNRFGFSYNYVLSNQLGIFSIGLRPSLYSWSWDGSQIVTPGGNYGENLIDHDDPGLAEGELSLANFNLDLGVHFKGERLQVGVFAGQILNTRAEVLNETGYRSNFEFGAYGEYDYEYNRELSFHPAALLLSDGLRWQTALKVGTLIDDTYYGGLGLRGYSRSSFDAVIISAGLKVSENFWMYYNYDIGISSLRIVHAGSHEITIVYRYNQSIGGVLPPKVIYNPRYQ